MKQLVILPALLSVVVADISAGACGPKPPTVPEFDKEMVSDVGCLNQSSMRKSRNHLYQIYSWRLLT